MLLAVTQVFKRLFLRLGFLDGKYGFVICFINSLSALLKYAKLKDLQEGKKEYEGYFSNKSRTARQNLWGNGENHFLVNDALKGARATVPFSLETLNLKYKIMA